MKSIHCFILLFSLIAADIYAGAMESEVKKARTLTSKGVIKCHPDGKDGGVTPLKALQLLKPGMTLHLLPAQSWSTLEIPQDRVIITSEGKKIHYSLKLKGRDCIIKNVNGESLSIVEDVVIIDSVLGSLGIGQWDERRIKIRAFLYNTSLNSLHTSGGENNSYNIEMKNCLVKGTISNYSNTKMSITDSVLASEGIVFSFTDYDNKKGRLLLKNNLLYGKSGYARMEYSPSSKKNEMTVLDPKDIRKLWSVSLSGEHIHEAPKYQTQQQLFLAEDSPGKGRGLISDEHPIFEIIKNKKDDDQVNRDKWRKEREEREKRRKEAREKRDAEKERRKKEHEKRGSDDDNPKDDDVDGDLGGVPKPPE